MLTSHFRLPFWFEGPICVASALSWSGSISQLILGADNALRLYGWYCGTPVNPRGSTRYESNFHFALYVCNLKPWPLLSVDSPPVPNFVLIHYLNRRTAQATFWQTSLRQSFSYGTGDTKISADSSDLMHRVSSKMRYE